MGCSASRLDSLLAKAIEDPSFSLSQTSSTSSSNSTFHNNNNNINKNNNKQHVISPMPKPRSLSTPLVHHPALRKGDSHHLVSLTSTTYGSLIVVDNHPTTTVDGGDFSPDSVINTWELMEGLEDDDDIEFNEGVGNDLKAKSLSFCDSNDVQKIPTLRLLSDSYVFVEKVGGQEMDGRTKTQYGSTEVGSISKNTTRYGPMEVGSISKNTIQFSPTEVGSVSKNTIQYSPTGVRSVSKTMTQYSPTAVGSISKIMTQYSPIEVGSISKTTAMYGPIEVGSREEKNCKTTTLYSLIGVGSNEEMNSKITTQDNPTEVGSRDDMNCARLNSKPLWKLLSEESLLGKMDPNVAASYQKALSGGSLGCNESRVMSKVVDSSAVGAKSKSVECSPMVSKLGEDDNAGGLVGCVDKIVLYFTSLRGIRKTYEDCCRVRLILRGFRVMVDERDISMDSSYRKELQSLLGGKAMTLPQLFVRGKRIGGADEIKQMHETGELERLLDGFPIVKGRFMCDSCGEARFMPCSSCNGSRKIFSEKEGRTMRCPDCNENGLVRCPACCY